MTAPFRSRMAMGIASRPIASTIAAKARSSSLPPSKKQQQRLWEAMGRPDLATTDRSARSMNASEHIRVLSELFKSRDARAWEEGLQAAHVPACRVCTIAEVAREPQFAARELVHRHEFVPGVEGPLSVPVAGFKYRARRATGEKPPPRVGEHTIATAAGTRLRRGDYRTIEAVRGGRNVGPDRVVRMIHL